ncbi:MAG: hypothetical protein LUE27_08695 [Clostridia bacterium]|nr:hypothetical protein [Clostridia bacterium]
MRKTIKVLAAVLAVATVGAVAAFAGCGGTEETYRFEAEKAVLWSDEDSINSAYGAWADYYITGVEEDVESASGEASVGYFCYEGSTITFTINSNKAVSEVPLTICAAASTMSWTTWAIDDYAASDHTDLLSVNGTTVALSGTLVGNSEMNYYNWGELTATIDLVKGENTIVLTIDDSGLGINVDYIEITTKATLTWTETNN